MAELRRELRESERQLERLRDELRSAHVRGANSGPRRREASVPLVLEEVPADGADDLRGWADRFLEFLGGSGVVVVSSGSNFAIKVSRDMAERHPATGLAPLLGRGGGRPEMAQGKGTRLEGLGETGQGVVPNISAVGGDHLSPIHEAAAGSFGFAWNQVRVVLRVHGQCQAPLLEVIQALTPSRRFSRGLDGWQQ